VPPTATTGKISVTTPSGTGTSAGNLVVVLPPTISGFSPLAGPVGTVVTVTGTSLDSVDSATLAGVLVGPITHPTASSIRFGVPEGVPGNQGKLVVHNMAGDSLASVGVFKVTPLVTSFEPSSVIRGQSVVVHGESFSGATVVKIGAVTAPITVPPAVVGDEQLAIQVPPTATTGKISVTTPSGTGTSAGNLVVVLPPTITSFAPTSGPVGTVVTVNGTNLDSVTTGTLNGADAGPITHLTATSLRLTVPPTAAPTGKITLTNPAATATSAASLTIPFLVTGFAPTAGAAGTAVTINGSGLSTVTLVEFNGSPTLPIASGPTSVAAIVPPLATTGRIRVTTATGQSAISSADFNITSIADFTPTIGAAGTPVTITGEGFGAVTSVDFNGAPASFTKDSATQITATVPAAATDGPIHLFIGAGGTATTATNFSVVRISNFNPSSAAVGTVVTVTGTHLSGATGVLFNGVAAASFTVNGAGTQLTAPVPPDGQTGPISVVTSNGNAVSEGSFQVMPVITEFAPHAGSPGVEVTIRGSGFVQVSSVNFQGNPAASVTVDSPTQIRATVPNVPLGNLNGPIALVTAGGTVVTDFFDQGFFSGGATAHLVLNEVNRSLIELHATSGGYLSGLKLVMNPKGTPVRLGALQGTVAAGDLVVIHAAPTSNGSPVFDEIPGLMPKSTCSHPDCFPNAWDFNASALNFGNIVLTTQDGFLVQDAVALSRVGSADAGFPAELQALQAQGAWSPANCGGAPCTYASNPTAPAISADWSAAGTFSSGTSVARTGASDTSALADWTAGAPSFGAANP
jgi:large repetitive protein